MQATQTAPVPIESTSSTPLLNASHILAHRKRGHGHEWLKLMQNSKTRDAKWQLTRDFVDSDGIDTKALHDYIVRSNLLHHLH